jgi:hypothetical protein
VTDPGAEALLFITVAVVDETQLQVLVVVKSVEKETGIAKVRFSFIEPMKLTFSGRK